MPEILRDPRNLTYHLLDWDPDYTGYGQDDIVECAHDVPELEALLRQAMVLHNQYRWDRRKTRATEVGKLHDDDFVVVFHPRNDDVLEFLHRVKSGRRPRPAKPAPAPSRHPVAPYKGERVCTNEDLIRNAAYSWSPMTAEEIFQKTGIRQ